MELDVAQNIFNSCSRVRSLTNELKIDDKLLILNSEIDQSWIIECNRSHITINGRSNHILVINSSNSQIDISSAPVSGIEMIRSSYISIRSPKIEYISGEFCNQTSIYGDISYISSYYSMGWKLNDRDIYLNPMEYQIYDNTIHYIFNMIEPKYFKVHLEINQ